MLKPALSHEQMPWCKIYKNKAGFFCDSGRKDLYYLVRKCGGSKIMAEYMGLKYVETRGRPANRRKSSEELSSKLSII